MGIGGKRCSAADGKPTPTLSFDTFVDNYFTSPGLLTYLGVNDI